MNQYFVYILTNHDNKLLYVGITNNLGRRLLEHKTGANDSFTKKYHIDKLVYYEETDNIYSALEREKQLKGWRREKKIELIETKNPKWNDLSFIVYA